MVPIYIRYGAQTGSLGGSRATLHLVCPCQVPSSLGQQSHRSRMAVAYTTAAVFADSKGIAQYFRRMRVQGKSVINPPSYHLSPALRRLSAILCCILASFQYITLKSLSSEASGSVLKISPTST